MSMANQHIDSTNIASQVDKRGSDIVCISRNKYRNMFVMSYLFVQTKIKRGRKVRGVGQPDSSN